VSENVCKIIFHEKIAEHGKVVFHGKCHAEKLLKTAEIL
jgi:hypothetical protein